MKPHLDFMALSTAATYQRCHGKKKPVLWICGVDVSVGYEKEHVLPYPSIEIHMYVDEVIPVAALWIDGRDVGYRPVDNWCEVWVVRKRGQAL